MIVVIGVPMDVARHRREQNENFLLSAVTVGVYYHNAYRVIALENVNTLD